ncbi:MAG: WYL domain-containing protein [Pseudomonadota bacterium]
MTAAKVRPFLQDDPLHWPALRYEILMSMARRLPIVRLSRSLAHSLGLNRRDLRDTVQRMIDAGEQLVWVGKNEFRLWDPRTTITLDLDDERLLTLLAALRRYAEGGHTRSELVDAAHLLHRIATQLPLDQFARLQAIGRFHVMPEPVAEDGSRSTSTRNLVTRALRDQRKLRVVYTDASENRTERLLWPVTLTNHDMSLAAWCELRQAFRTFNLHSMAAVEVLDGAIPDTAEALLAKWRARGV